jgi:hypothetical protein
MSDVRSSAHAFSTYGPLRIEAGPKFLGRAIESFLAL